jgi:type IV pilus assembly protein PilO
MDLNVDLNDLDFSALLRAPDWLKAVALGAVALLLVALFGWFVVEPHNQEMERLEGRVQSLKAQYLRKRRQVAHLPALKEQLDELEGRMDRALEQLPDRSEVASLLVEVTRAGRAEGLSFNLFRPQPEKHKEFYAELPVEVEVAGTYNAFGQFLAATASLPRIVNIDQLRIRSSGDKLIMKCQARTFRYLPEGEGADKGAQQ